MSSSTAWTRGLTGKPRPGVPALPRGATLSAERAGLQVLGTSLTGTSSGGLRLVLKTVAPSNSASSQARDTL